MWLMFKRFLMMSVASWAVAKAARRYPRLEGVSRVLKAQRYGSVSRAR